MDPIMPVVGVLAVGAIAVHNWQASLVILSALLGLAVIVGLVAGAIVIWPLALICAVIGGFTGGGIGALAGAAIGGCVGLAILAKRTIFP